MELFTCGSRSEIPVDVINKFDGVVGGYFWGDWESPTPREVAKKYQKTKIRNGFLYGNKHTNPDLSSGCATIEDWILKKIRLNAYVNQWVLVNEFINERDNFNPYPNYDIENLKRYFAITNKVNPDAELIIGDFRPHQLKRWQKIKAICEQLLSENIPIHGVGIQVHFKTRNAHSRIPGVPYILDALPAVIKLFDGVLPVHLIEVSGWHHYSEKPEVLTPLWDEVLAIASTGNVASFCPWWLNEDDVGYPRKMPTFEEFLGAGIFDKDWNQKLRLPAV